MQGKGKKQKHVLSAAEIDNNMLDEAEIEPEELTKEQRLEEISNDDEKRILHQTQAEIDMLLKTVPSSSKNTAKSGEYHCF